jgi:hypothetical protein
VCVSADQINSLCKICSSPVGLFAHAKILDKFRIQYFRCYNCGFVQTEAPFWLEDAYSEAINSSDVGLVSRNMRVAMVSRAVIAHFFNAEDIFLDYAGGYGLYVRLMRDAGFNFYWHDLHCTNLFAKGFEASLKDEAYELVTAFDVFEHLENPLETIESLLKLTKNIFFTTQLLPCFPRPAPQPDEWWYYGLDHGQHISLFTDKSLASIAGRFSLNYYTDGKSVHLFTEKKLNSMMFRLWTRYLVAAMYSLIYRRKSLTQHDYAGSQLPVGKGPLQ